MNFAALKTELSDRGFSHLSDTRLGSFINQARAELDNAVSWPYRLTTASGAAPLTITDLGRIEEVVDTANNSQWLQPIERTLLRRMVGDLTTTGTPTYFYIDNGVVRTYPVGGTLSVRYFKRTAVLTGTDTPLAPADYHMLIVDMAARWAYKDSDSVPPGLQADIEGQFAQMVQDLMLQQQAGTKYVQSTGRNY